ncbi:MAG: hypothetical protein DRH15_08130 [Deltaproteobacteria bacterium]|nr:MAG: hypothetical protein DRH15_08130 [Deltaproteobacteria bacterium]
MSASCDKEFQITHSNADILKRIIVANALCIQLGGEHVKIRAIRTKVVFCIVLFAAILFSGLALAGGYYHIVQEGDTLWDICEKYYGNPWLWPKLWEMNPFITNPNLLKPGDKIKLTEEAPFIRPAAKEENAGPEKVEASPREVKQVNWWSKGIDVSQLTNVKAIGYLSYDKPVPLGSIIAADQERLILHEGDTVIIELQDFSPRVGDLVWAYRVSRKLKHPHRDELVGYAVSIIGNLKVTRALENSRYQAIINESFRDVRVGDLLTMYRPVSPCVIPTPAPEGLDMEVLATKDLVEIVGQFTVVYIEHGSQQGLRRGNLFEVVRPREGLPDLVIGYVLLLDTRPNTSVGIVVESLRPFYRGSKLRPLNWGEAPHYLSQMQPCS